MNKKPHLELRRGVLFHHYALVGVNGETMMASETYYSKSNALRAIGDASVDLDLNWIDATKNPMKTKNTLLIIGAIIAIAVITSTGCKSTDPATGERHFDIAKTEKVKASIEPVISSAVRRVVSNSPGHSDEIAAYLRAVGGVFCSASESGQLGPEQIIAAVDMATADLQAGVDPEIVDAKNVLIALYRINYSDRFRAELPPDQWPKNIADVLCHAIDQGLKDAGKPGVK